MTCSANSRIDRSPSCIGMSMNRKLPQKWSQLIRARAAIQQVIAAEAVEIVSLRVADEAVGKVIASPGRCRTQEVKTFQIVP